MADLPAAHMISSRVWLVLTRLDKPIAASPLDTGARGAAGREGPLCHETEQLQGGETDHAEHQVAHHLGGSAHPHGPATMVVLQPAIDPLHRAAFAVTYVFRHAVPDQALPLRFLFQLAGCEFQAPQKCLRLIKVYAINFIP